MEEKEPGVSKLKAVLKSAGRITRKGLRAATICGMILLPTCGFTNIFGKWVYQVKTNYGVVVTEWDGNRVAVDKQGWHSRVPLLSTYEDEYSLANQMVFLHGKTQSHEIITKEGTTEDGAVIMAAAATFYEIVDLKQYAIQNFKGSITIVESFSDGPRIGLNTQVIDPRIMVQRTLDSIIGEQIQRRNPKDIIHDRRTVEQEILEVIVQSDLQEMYGIKINGFRFTETSYIPKVVEANANKQAAVARAEGEYAAAQIEKKSTVVRAEAEYAAAQVRKKSIETLAAADAEQYRILEKALGPKTADEKRRVQEIFQSIVKYKTIKDRVGDTVWMLPESNSVLPVYNPSSESRRPFLFMDRNDDVGNPR